MIRKLKEYTPTPFKAKDSVYDKQAADNAVSFIECLSHTKGTWAGKPFLLIDWQEQIIRDVFGTLKPSGYRQFNTAYIEIPKKNGKSELAAAVALLLTCGDDEERAEVYGCAADRQQAFDRWGAVQMVQNLEGMGFTVAPFGQGFKDMSPPTKELMKLTLEQKIVHGGQPVLRWMMDNIYIRTDPAGNIKPDKEKSTEKIDGAVATIMALDRALRNGGGENTSVYAERGILFL